MDVDSIWTGLTLQSEVGDSVFPVGSARLGPLQEQDCNWETKPESNKEEKVCLRVFSSTSQEPSERSLCIHGTGWEILLLRLITLIAVNPGLL